MMLTRALDGEVCWQCGSRQASAMNVANQHPMRAGDVAICPYCSAVSVVEEVDGAFTSRPPDTSGPDAELLGNTDLMTLLFVRTLHMSGLMGRKCPQCGVIGRVVGALERAPRFMDEVDCTCGAKLQVGPDYSLGLREG